MITDRLIVKGEEKVQKMGEPEIRDDSMIEGLLKRTRGGDYEAFGELYSIYLDRIYRYVFYQVKDRMTAEDLTEEIFMKAWRAISTYTGPNQSFSNWLFQIALNHVVDSFRAKRPNISLDSLEMEIPDNNSDPALEVEMHMTQEQLLELLAFLPLNQRQVIILKFVEGLDNREIEQATGKSQGAIRIMQMRALSMLREQLTKEKRADKWITNSVIA